MSPTLTTSAAFDLLRDEVDARLAQWGRNTLREGGCIRSDSPHGVWEITDKGRAWLAEAQKTAAHR